MTGWRYFLLNLLWWMWLLYPVVYLVYLLATGIRRARSKPRADLYWARTAAYHGRWGIALAVPGLTISIMGGLGYDWEWVAAPALIGSLLSCALADLAMREVRIPTPAAWIPLAVVIYSVAVFTVFAGNEGPATEWAREDHSSLEFYFGEFLMLTNFGFAFVTWVAVATNFALSVRRVARARERDLVQLAQVPGFVWPY